MKKRINKILWYGDELSEGKAKAPNISVNADGLDGLNEGEVFIANNEADPAIFIRTSSGKVVRIGGADLEVLKKLFLSKTEDDTAKGLITFEQGAEYGDYTPSATGACIKQDANGNWLIETDNLFVRKKATFTSVEIQDVHHVGGQLLLTSASAVIDLVTELDNGYKCYFRKVDSEGNTITNDWMVGDQAYCNTFNIEKQSDGKAENHFYWRKVTGKGTEGDFHYIILSKDESGEIEGRTFNDAPLEGDNVVQLGYQGSNDPDRQNAIIIAGAGQNSPYIYQFTGIDSFTLPEPETKIKPGDNLLTGVMNIQAGSTGAGNLTDIGDAITREAEKFAYGKYNLLRNTSFRGDYTSANLAEDSEMGDASVYSQALTYWSVVNGDVSVQESEVAELKREIRLNGAIQQALVSPLIAGESYVCSFRAKGAYVAFSVAGIALLQSLTDEYKRYVLKFTAGNAGDVFSFVGNATVCDIQLERGNMASAWGLSVYDNGHELEYMQALNYLATAIKDGDTEILGGLLLTSIIKVGKYLDGKMESNTAGISGIYNDDEDVAFWGGGTFEQAIKTVSRFRNNPNYTPTEEDWKSMANYVVTHGGDSFLRGYIYALGGVFRGTVYAKDGEFSGRVNAKSGSIGGFDISENSISANESTLNLGVDDFKVKFQATQETEKQITLIPSDRSFYPETIPFKYNENRHVTIPFENGLNYNNAHVVDLLDINFHSTRGVGIDSYSGNYGYQYAMLGNGHICLNGMVEGHGLDVVNFSGNGELLVLTPPYHCNRIAVKEVYSDNALILPNLTNMLSAIGVGFTRGQDGIPFSFRFTIINLSDNTFRIAGYNEDYVNNGYPFKDSNFPRLYVDKDDKTSISNSYSLSKKCSVDIMLIYDGTDYIAMNMQV